MMAKLRYSDSFKMRVRGSGLEDGDGWGRAWKGCAIGGRVCCWC